jgi:hypothetical protein
VVEDPSWRRTVVAADRIRDALLPPSEIDIDARLDALNAEVFRRERPPVA